MNEIRPFSEGIQGYNSDEVPGTQWTDETGGAFVSFAGKKPEKTLSLADKYRLITSYYDAAKVTEQDHKNAVTREFMKQWKDKEHQNNYSGDFIKLLQKIDQEYRLKTGGGLGEKLKLPQDEIRILHSFYDIAIKGPEQHAIKFPRKEWIENEIKKKWINRKVPKGETSDQRRAKFYNLINDANAIYEGMPREDIEDLYPGYEPLTKTKEKKIDEEIKYLLKHKLKQLTPTEMKKEWAQKAHLPSWWPEYLEPKTTLYYVARAIKNGSSAAEVEKILATAGTTGYPSDAKIKIQDDEVINRIMKQRGLDKKANMSWEAKLLEIRPQYERDYKTKYLRKLREDKNIIRVGWPLATAEKILRGDIKVYPRELHKHLPEIYKEFMSDKFREIPQGEYFHRDRGWY